MKRRATSSYDASLIHNPCRMLHHTTVSDCIPADNECLDSEQLWYDTAENDSDSDYTAPAELNYEADAVAVGGSGVPVVVGVGCGCGGGGSSDADD